MLWNVPAMQCVHKTPSNEALRRNYYIDWKRTADLIEFRNYLEQKNPFFVAP